MSGQERRGREQKFERLLSELEDSKHKVEAEKQKYQAILEGLSSLGDGLLLVDEDFHVEYMNPVVIESFGDQIGKVCYRSLGWSTEHCLHCQLQTLALGHEVVRHRAVTFHDRVYEVSVIPLKSHDGGTSKLEIIRDVTERKRLEEQLIKSEKLAAVGHLAAAVAHEIRNPLGTIVMAARELSGESLLREDRQVMVDILNKEADRLSATLTDFLRFARPREPQITLNDPYRMLSDILRVIENDPNLRQAIEIMADLDETVRVLPFDLDQVEQVIWNIMLNALQAMEGKGRLTVVSTLSNGAYRMTVSDTGKGIPKDEIGRIFEPFYTTKKEGTGLGLSIAQRVVDAHGGTIFVESKVGVGTVFTVLLPVSS
ncbi:MAG: PAS domain-containing protein [Candidatus Latescibacteria bacterium]|nr:PAS domain-containing protein [Candidatus Latescibacterota bacterium]